MQLSSAHTLPEGSEAFPGLEIFFLNNENTGECGRGTCPYSLGRKPEQKSLDYSAVPVEKS